MLLIYKHTHSAHTPDNSFMGFVTEELNETEKWSIQQNKVNNMAVVYGKEASMWKVLHSLYRKYTQTFAFVQRIQVHTCNAWMCRFYRCRHGVIAFSFNINTHHQYTANIAI